MPEYEHNCKLCSSKVKNIKDHWRRLHEKEYDEWKANPDAKDSDLWSSRKKVSDSISSSRTDDEGMLPEFAFGNNPVLVRKRLKAMGSFRKRADFKHLTPDEIALTGERDPVAPRIRTRKHSPEKLAEIKSRMRKYKRAARRGDEDEDD